MRLNYQPGDLLIIEFGEGASTRSILLINRLKASDLDVDQFSAIVSTCDSVDYRQIAFPYEDSKLSDGVSIVCIRAGEVAWSVGPRDNSRGMFTK